MRGDTDCCAKVFRNRTKVAASVEIWQFRCRAVAMLRMAGAAIDLGSWRQRSGDAPRHQPEFQIRLQIRLAGGNDVKESKVQSSECRV